MSSAYRSWGLVAVTGAALLLWQTLDDPRSRAVLDTGAAPGSAHPARPPTLEPAALATIAPTTGDRQPPPAEPRRSRTKKRKRRPQSVAVAPPQPAATEQDRTAPTCDTEIRISALLYDRHEPARSTAVLRGGAWAGGRTVSLGSRVGERRIAEIAPRGLRLQDAASACWIGMFTPGSRQKVAREHSGRGARAASTSRTAAQRGFSKAELARGIRQVDALHYGIARPLLEHGVARPSDVVAALRLSPVREGRRVVGMKVGSISRASAAFRLGLKRGDLLRTLNGFGLGDRDALRTAFAALPRAARLVLVVERDRRLVTLNYAVD